MVLYIVFDKVGVFLNGNLHWPAYVQGRKLVFSYNLAEEKIKYLESHDHNIAWPPFNLNFTLGTYGGQLCSVFKREDMFEFWVMKEYGVKESWKRLNTIEGFGLYDSLVPLEFLKNGDLIVDADRKTIARYSFNNKKVTTLKIHSDKRSCSIAHVAKYEMLIIGLEIGLEMHMYCIKIFCHSQIIIMQFEESI